MIRTHALSALGSDVATAATATDAMKLAGLADWNVRKAPIHAIVDHGATFPIPGRYAVVHGQHVLGNVGEKYRVIQNEEHAPFLDALADETGATFSYAGTLEDGRWAFVAVRLPGHLVVGKDHVENHLTAVKTHDGSLAFTLMATPVVVGRGALLNVALDGSRANVFTARGGKGSATALKSAARQVTDQAFTYLEDFQAQAARMAATPLTVSRFERIITDLYGAPANAARAAVSRTDRKLLEMATLFAEQPEGTAWAGAVAIAEWHDHLSPTRGATPDASRFQKALVDPKFKSHAFAALAARTH